MADSDTNMRKAMKGQSRPFPDRARDEMGEKFIRSYEDIDDPLELAQSLISRFQEAAEYRLPFEEEWRFAVRAWFQVPTEEREDAWESDRYLPIILKHVETALPAIVAATLNQNGIFRMHGMTRLAKNYGQAHERLANFQASNQSGAEEAYEDMYWWSVLLGSAFVDHVWDQRDEERMIPTDVEDDEGQVTRDFEPRTVEVANHPKVECLNPFDVYAAPSGKMGLETRYFFLRVETTLNELIALAGEGHIDGPALHDWIQEDAPQSRRRQNTDWFDGYAGYTWEEILAEMGYEDEEDLDEGGQDLADFDKTVVVMKYVAKDVTITMGSPKHIIGFSRNLNTHGKTGILIHQFYKIPDCPYGRGLGAVLRGHQSLGNENINSFMDAARLELMAPLEVDRTRANLLDEDLVLQPRSIIRTRGGGAITPIPMPSPTNLAMTVASHIEHDADDLTGFSEQARGLASSGEQTATAFQGTQSNLRTRLVTHVRRSGRTLQRSGELFVSLNRQYFTEAQMVSFIGEDGLDYVEVNPEDLDGNPLVGVSISSARASPDARAQRLMQILQIMIPLIQGGMLQQPQVRRMVRMILDANEVEDADLLIPKEGDLPKDAGVENEMMRQMIRVPVLPSEPHTDHLAKHQMLMNELLEDDADSRIIEVVKEHMAAHHQAVGQQAASQAQAALGAGTPEQQAQGASGAGIGPGGGDPAQQEANLAGAATGGQGVPGVAAPGPAAPGRIA